jgi:hypothetical protein
MISYWTLVGIVVGMGMLIVWTDINAGRRPRN